MNTAAWIVILIGTAMIAFFAGFDLCWRNFVLRRARRAANPNPFGELPPVTPNAEPEAELEREHYVPMVDRKTLAIAGVVRVPIHHNANPDARN